MNDGVIVWGCHSMFWYGTHNKYPKLCSFSWREKKHLTKLFVCLTSQQTRCVPTTVKHSWDDQLWHRQRRHGAIFSLCWSIDFFLGQSSAAYNRIFGLALTRAQSKYGQMLKEIRSALIMKNEKVKLAREWPSPIIDLKECSRRCQMNLNMKKPTFDMNLALTTANLSIFQFSFHTTRKEKKKKLFFWLMDFPFWLSQRLFMYTQENSSSYDGISSSRWISNFFKNNRSKCCVVAHHPVQISLIVWIIGRFFPIR